MRGSACGTGSCRIRGGSPPRLSRTLLSFRFLFDDHFDVAGNLLVEPDGHGELAQGLQWFVELDLAAVDGVSLLLELSGDISGGYRAEELVVLAGTALEFNGDTFQALGHGFRVRLLAFRTARCCCLHLINDGPVRNRRFDGKLARQQEIAAVPFRHFNHIPAPSQLRHIFFQNDGHVMTPFEYVVQSCWRTMLVGAQVLTSLRAGAAPDAISLGP